MYASILQALLQIPLCWYFIDHREMGINGIAITESILLFIYFMAIIIYSYCSKNVSPALRPINIEAFRGWGQYMVVAFPTIVIMVSIWLSFATAMLIAGICSPKMQAAKTIQTTLTMLVLSVPDSIQQSSNGVIGNCFGANNVALARRFLPIMITFTILSSGLIGLIGVITRDPVNQFFSDDEEVVQMLARAQLLYYCLFVIDGLQSFLNGATRAMGLQKKSAYVTLATNWLLFIPLAYIFVLKEDMYLFGENLGYEISMFFGLVGNLYIVYSQNWQEIANAAVLRIKQEADETDSRQ